ncbi:TPA: VWA domain-containing protein [Candidatus Bathyarchaeota archaeon]|nr:VWA domain-containing protein [Candidatus Bathyarchaeota archaeon]
METRSIDIVKLFNQAWSELYCPPVRLSITEEPKNSNGEAKFLVTDGTIYLKPDIIPRGVDPEEYLLWYFRHQLAHVHHCPYDIRTAYSLERAAYELVHDWDLAYLATQIFSDVQIDLHYLAHRFGDFPYHVRVIGKNPSTLAERIIEGIYLCVNPAVKIGNESLSEAAREIILVSSLERTWHTKVQMIASILSRLKKRNPHAFSKKELKKSIRNNPLNVREDFFHSTIEGFLETYGSITNEEAAREFFEQWIKPRLSSDEEEKAKKILKTSIGKRRKKRGLKKPKSNKEPGMSDEKKDTGNQEPLKVDPHPFYGNTNEPHLPTYLSRPYERIKRGNINEILWKRYWFKSRAQRAIIQYIAESRRRRPVWSVMRYPDEWYIEDEIEDLDVETSLDEGPLMPEVTTLKWIEEPAPHGQSFTSGFVPSTITVLDVSRSMYEAHNEAAVAAFIAYLSARRSGGNTAAVTFSTGFVSADWKSPEEMKELTLSMKFDEFTIFPFPEIQRLISENRGPCFIVIITDGGWQNIEEAIPSLKNISDSGHKIVIFLIKGGEYTDRVELIKRTPRLKIQKVVNPEDDLHGLVLSESMKTYRSFVT